LCRAPGGARQWVLQHPGAHGDGARHPRAVLSAAPARRWLHLSGRSSGASSPGLKAGLSAAHTMSQTPTPAAEDFTDDRPVVFRNATVLTVDPSRGVIANGDVLVVDQRIAEIGQQLTVPDGTIEIEGADGILLPGM